VAVLVAAAALESRLKKIAVLDEFKTYSYDFVVDSVFGKNGVMGQDATRADALKDLFKLRNRIAHRGEEPESQDAVRVLDLVRDTFETLAERLGEVG
jgi:hypothetical protein